MRIAVDAMGGDHAPQVVVEGALASLGESGVRLALVGDRQAIEDELKAQGADSSRIGASAARRSGWPPSWCETVTPRPWSAPVTPVRP